MRSTKLKLKKHLSNFVAFLVFANTLGTGRVFATGTVLGSEGTAAAATGTVNGTEYTVAAENSTGVVKQDGTIITAGDLGDGEVGYNYQILRESGQLHAAVTVENIATFEALKQAMSNAPAEVEGVVATASGASATTNINVSVFLIITISNNITVTEELSCKAKMYAIYPNDIAKTISRDANYKGTLFFVESGTKLVLLTNSEGLLTINGGNVEGCASLILVDADAECILDDVVLQNNKAVYGGAIYNKGILEFNHVSIHDCSAEQGGAIFNRGIVNGGDTEGKEISKCNATVGGAVVNCGDSAGFNLNGFTFDASNYATEKGNQIYTSGNMLLSNVDNFVLNKSNNGDASGVDIFIESKPIVLNASVNATQFVNTPTVYMTTYDQASENAPKLWRGATVGESVFANSTGNSFTVEDLDYAGPEILQTDGMLAARSTNLLHETTPCSGYVGTQVNGSDTVTEYLPVYFTGSTTGYDSTKSYVINSLTGKEVLGGSAIKVESNQNTNFVKSKSASETIDDETDVDVLAKLRVDAPAGTTTEYFNITWGDTAAGFYTLVLCDTSGAVVGIAPFYYDAVEPEFENITYKIGTADAVEVANGSSSVSVTGNVSSGVALAFDFSDAGVAAVKTIALEHPASSGALDDSNLSKNPTEAPYVNHCEYTATKAGTYTFKLTDFSGRTNSLIFNVGGSSTPSTPTSPTYTPTYYTPTYTSNNSYSSSGSSYSGSSSSGSYSSGSSSSGSSSSSATTEPADITTVTTNGRTMRSTSGNFSLTGSGGIFESADSLRSAANADVMNDLEIISGEKIPMDEVAWAATTTATTNATSATTAKTTTSTTTATTATCTTGTTGSTTIINNYCGCGTSVKKNINSKVLFSSTSDSVGESGKSGFKLTVGNLRKAVGSTETGEMSEAEANKLNTFMQNWMKKNGIINLDTDMTENSILEDKAVAKNKKLFGHGEDIQTIAFGKTQKELPFTLNVYGAVDLISKKLKIDLPCSVYKISRSTGKLIKNMGVYTMNDGVVTFDVDNTKYAYVIEESPMVVEKTKGKYEIIDDDSFKMTLENLKAKTKNTIRLVINDEDSALLIDSADIQASTATSKDKLLLQVEKQDATKYKNGSKTLSAKTNIVLDTGDLGTLGCKTTIYLETGMKKKSITVWGLNSKGAIVKLGKAKTDANGILKITAKAATLKTMGKSKVTTTAKE